jgi:hypothetical protein
MECPICMNNINNNDICITSCDHRYCYDCLSRWLSVKNTCPNCRKSIETFNYKDMINRIFIINDNRDIENLNMSEIRGMLNDVNYYNNKIKKLLIGIRVISSLSILFFTSSIYLFIECDVI